MRENWEILPELKLETNAIVAALADTVAVAVAVAVPLDVEVDVPLEVEVALEVEKRLFPQATTPKLPASRSTGGRNARAFSMAVSLDNVLLEVAQVEVERSLQKYAD